MKITEKIKETIDTEKVFNYFYKLDGNQKNSLSNFLKEEIGFSKASLGNLIDSICLGVLPTGGKKLDALYILNVFAQENLINFGFAKQYLTSHFSKLKLY